MLRMPGNFKIKKRDFFTPFLTKRETQSKLIYKIISIYSHI